MLCKVPEEFLPRDFLLQTKYSASIWGGIRACSQLKTSSQPSVITRWVNLGENKENLCSLQFSYHFMCRIIYNGSVWFCYIFPVCDAGPSPGCKCHPERTEIQITAQMFKTCHILPAFMRCKSCKCKYLRWFSIYEWGITDMGAGEPAVTITWFLKKSLFFYQVFFLLFHFHLPSHHNSENSLIIFKF